MDLRELEPQFAVTPQLHPEEMQDLADLGYTTVICNRPDGEVSPDLQMAAMRIAATEAGLNFVENPLPAGALSMDAIARQGEARVDSAGLTVAYCASGTRSAVLWAFSHAHDMPAREALAATEKAGYPLDGLAPQIEALAARS